MSSNKEIGFFGADVLIFQVSLTLFFCKCVLVDVCVCVPLMPTSMMHNFLTLCLWVTISGCKINTHNLLQATGSGFDGPRFAVFSCPALWEKVLRCLLKMRKEKSMRTIVWTHQLRAQSTILPRKSLPKRN